MKGQVQVLDATFSLLIFLMLIFGLITLLNNYEPPKYSIKTVHQSVLSYFLVNIDNCDADCVFVYREGLEEGTVTGYVLSLESNDKVIHSWHDGDSSDSVFISSRFLPCPDNSTILCKLELKTYVEG